MLSYLPCMECPDFLPHRYRTKGGMFHICRYDTKKAASERWRPPVSQYAGRYYNAPLLSMILDSTVSFISDMTSVSALPNASHDFS